jgi:hypothetical protein
MARAVLCAFAFSLALATPAFAAEPAQSYTLSWVRAEGTDACPPASALRAEVERRLGRAVFDPAAQRGFEVEVTRFGDKYRSDLFVRGPTGQMLGHRTLESDEPGCGALVNATALAIALVIDPEAASREPPPAPAAATFAPPVVSPPVVSPPVVSPPAPPAQAPSTRSAPPAVAIAPQPAVALSLRGSLQLGLVPTAAPGVALAFALRPVRRWSFSVQAEYTSPRDVTRGVGSLKVGLTRASVLATLQLLRAPGARWTVGAGPSVGALHVAVREPTPVTGPGDYWFSAVELGTTLELHVNNRFFVELGAGALAIVERQQFVVRGQDEPVWSQPRVAGSLFGGAGALFP